MAKAKTVNNKDEEIEVRNDIDYDNAMDEYKAKRSAVDEAVDMISTPFWIKGFKKLQVLFSKTHAKLVEEVANSNAENYDSSESIKNTDKANLEHKNAAKALDHYISTIVEAVDQLSVFCKQDDLPLFEEVTYMNASFSRKTGKIKSFKA